MINKILIGIILICVTLALPLHAGEYGKMRALKERAVNVTNRKNTFIALVLNTYAIRYECNAAGDVVRLEKEGKWLDVTRIEIIPLLQEAGPDGNQLRGHELLFYTSDGLLDLVSELKVP